MNKALPASVEFSGAELAIIDHDGQPWLTAADLSRALGYSNARAVTNIFSRHSDEFTTGMALVLNMSTRGAVAPKPVRIFSPRGCHLVAMFAHTDRAAAFRRWVLDVLEGLATPAPPARGLPLQPAESELLRSLLESIMWQFCGVAPVEVELAETRSLMAGINADLRDARLSLQHAEQRAREIMQPRPKRAHLAVARSHAATPHRSGPASGTTPELSPATQADLEKLRQELEHPPRN